MRHLEAESGKWLTVRPAESEQPVAEINLLPKAEKYTKTPF
ncbi:hypothetical protein ABID52_003641 [Fictibacillus halophilus]|uniref:Uncharacterized protein n=1 Tax=Fictibacillus halophilus TaxID=1610490 RepID=A0ABV2LN71_9BACL